MSCCGEREKGPPERKQRWDFITLSDFRKGSVWTRLAYAWLWFMAGVGVAVYAVDTFTCINLLAFNRWSSQVQPQIPIKYSKWIFAGCIFLSFALCAYEWIRAIRVIKRDGVAASYMDPLAASLQSMRKLGWRRFLVFTELTRSKKGTDYVAFFVYFAFQSAVRVILAEGPRQVVNAITLYAVLQANVIKDDSVGDQSPIAHFFSNLGALADQDLRQTVIFCSMLFTLVIWVFSAICLLLAGFLYIVFLWHYIPQRDGRLRIYCRRKIDRRLEKIVAKKTEEAIEDDNRRKERAEKKAELKRQKTGELPPPPVPGKLARQPTLPMVDESPVPGEDDKLPGMPLSRQDTNATMSTLPSYSSRPPTQQGLEREPMLPDMALINNRPEMPSRMGTNYSARSQVSFESDAPLLSNAGYAGGDGRVASPAPTYSRNLSNASLNNSLPGRTMTQSTLNTQRSFTPISRLDTPASQRSFTPMSATSAPPPLGQRLPTRSNTEFSFNEPQSASSQTSPNDGFGQPMVPLPRVPTADGFRSEPRRKDSEVSYFSRPVAATPEPGVQRMPTFGSLHSQQSSFSRPGPPRPRKSSQGSSFRPFSPMHEQDRPTPEPNSYEMTSQPPYGFSNVDARQQPLSNQYTAFKPAAPGTVSTPVYQSLKRNVTYTGQQGAGDYRGHVPQRSITAPVESRMLSSYGSILDEYGGYSPEEAVTSRISPPTGPPRANTASPYGSQWQSRY